jgi:GNAT superfamily N-acetyltransferase
MTASQVAAPPDPITADQLTIAPANEASWADLQAIFGTTGYPGRCYCQSYKIRDRDWRSVSEQQRRQRLRQQTGCGNPAAATSTGLVGYLDAEPPARTPVGWVAVEPRTAYQRLRWTRTVWAGRDEDKEDDGVWAVTCFVTRAGYRKRGITYALAAATIAFARAQGAAAVEGYPMIPAPGKEVTWGEVHVGTRQVFAAAGFTEVARPSFCRAVMRVEFG